jgi:hypothetical protein
MLAFLYVLIIVAVVFGVVGIVNALVNARTKGAKTARQQVAVAERTLRSIANGSGNPVLEAQIALDEISNLYETKELS